MKLACKTLKGERFTLNVEIGDTVQRLKDLVASHLANAGAADGYRLIYSGKLLKDSDTLSSAGVKETGFVVIMPPMKHRLLRKKQSTAPSMTNTGAPTESTQATSSIVSGKRPTTSTPAGSSKSVEVPTTSAVTTTGTAAAQTAVQPAPQVPLHVPTVGQDAVHHLSSARNQTVPLTGEAYESSVRQICAMGFPEEQVRRAMQAVCNNPGRAVDYLFSGTPEIADQRMGSGTLSNTSAHATASVDPGHTNQEQQTPERVMPGTPFDMFGGAGGSAVGSQTAAGLGARNHQEVTDAVAGQTQGRISTQRGGDVSGNLDFLRQIPQFEFLRHMILEHPGLLPQILQHMDHANPSLLRIISANLEEFARIINEQAEEGGESGSAAVEPLLEALANSEEGSHGIGESGEVLISPDENEQLNRLSDLAETWGIHPKRVIETWLECGRDENVAANYLYDHMEEIKAAQDEEEAMADSDNERKGDPNTPGPGGQCE